MQPRANCDAISASGSQNMGSLLKFFSKAWLERATGGPYACIETIFFDKSPIGKGAPQSYYGSLLSIIVFVRAVDAISRRSLLSPDPCS